MDWLGIAGLLVGLIALAVAVYGIRDVRNLMRDLILLERNRALVKVLHSAVYRVVDHTEETAQFESSADMQEFIMLVRTLQPEIPFDDVQAYANNEVLSLAKAMVENGLGKWKEHIDESVVLEHVKSWETDKITAVVKNMFADHASLKFDTRKKMVKY